ncbi:pre-mRNA-splicing factor CWC25 homolog [Coccinella septempunctata]|uniref:pre-mRNA-splicing factor CWC25 homolog n=1 Tax=Coccinella septempunctata TaxID=41139 RepID=UPI001D08ED0E|nr:pre-mRNA-splicing factor CWC25 homolog [Coccinella septempunctata]
MFSNNEEKKLDWMYKGPTALVDRESYLLGRSVDKTLEELNKEEATKTVDKLILPPKNHVEHECIPPSIRDYNKIVKSEQVDLQAKLQEDPLVLIKRQEEESRRQFLQNPVQLKKLQEAMETQLKKRSHHGKTDKKLKKKLKKLSKQLGKKDGYKKLKVSSDMLEDEEILDTILMHKFNLLKNELSEDDLKNILLGDCSESDDSDEEKQKNRNKKSKSKSDDRQNIKVSSSRKRKSSSSPERHKSTKKVSDFKEREKLTSKKPKDNDKKRLTEEEKEALRKSMMERAAVRNLESARNFKRFKDEYNKPEIVEEHDKNFIRNELLKSANSSSVADRIKANVNNIQRSKFSMESNFLK